MFHYKIAAGVYLSILPLLMFKCAAATNEERSSTQHSLTVNDLERTFLVHTPAGNKDIINAPLMIVLHGGLGNAAHAEKAYGMNGIADSEKFLVAYPDGIGGRLRKMKNRRTWNAGNCCGPAAKRNVDDVGFIEEMIEYIAVNYKIDPTRVYITGMSNGAMMAYRFACERPDKVAAIIPVAGTLAIDDFDNGKNVAVLHIHGDMDQNVPFEGGKGSKSVSGVMHRSVPDTIDLITRARQCSSSSKEDLINNAHLIAYNCLDGAPVELITIKGGGHSWPGGKKRGTINSTSQSISASRLAWDFAKKFSTKLP